MCGVLFQKHGLGVVRNSFLKQLFLLVSICIITNYCIMAEQQLAEEDGPLSDVQTAVNLDVSLPCNLTPGTTIQDKVQLVIWYKKGHVKPIYTFDARGRQLHQATRWADEFVLKNKADFFYDSNPPILRIQNVQMSDAGLYKCRVDFHKSPTRNFRINVTVLVPPTNLTILDTYGESIKHNIAGPYIEGNNINLTCLSSGGIPPPKVTWWKEHALVDKSFQVFPDGTVKNILHLYNISRKDLFSVYTCHANNGHMAPVLSKKVTVEIILPPLNILLQGLNHPLVAGVSTQITCTSVGARPPPKIQWKKGGFPMLDASQTTSADGNLTISELVFIPAPEDNKKEIECVVANTLDHKQDLMIETNFDDNPYKKFEFFFKDFRFLNVTHAPIVSLNLGAPLDADNLLIGSDVYLECTIVANPAITRIEWYHNDRKLHSSRGILISNQTLVLQGISKTTHGKYFCLAINIQGSVSSNEIFLDVKYPPMCKTESTIIRAAIKQVINITCLVDSNPTNSLDYKWRFNSSLDSSIELPYNSRQMHGFDNLSPISLPLKGKISTLEHEHTYCNHCHQNHHSHHHRGLLKKNQRSLIDLIDFRTKAHLPPSVLSTSLISQLYTTTPNKSHNISGHWSYTNVLSENGTQLLNEFIKVDNNEPSYKGSSQDDNQDAPFAEMLYSNMVYTNQLPETQRVYNKNVKLLKKENNDEKVNNELGISVYDQSNKGNHILPINSVYQYNIESYESFGAVSCVASNQIGQSQPCWYHIQPADLPDAVKSCIAYNVTPSSIEVHCIPGYDGGIQQHFHVQVYDELNRQVLYNKTFRHSNFKINRLPSDSVFLLRITSINLQGSSKLVYRFRARTLSMPLLQTASSTAVLVQLTPLLGALLGLVTTLVLMVICIAIFIKLRTKNIYHSNINSIKSGNKGSVELFNRNMGSRSSLEDKNPDVVPLENSEDEFCADRETINRLNMSYRVLSTQPTRHENISSSSSSQLQPLTLKQNPDSVFHPSSSNNICNSPERVNKTFSTPSTSLLSNKATSNIYTRIPEKTYYPNFEPQTTSSSPYGSLTISTMPLLEQRKTSHIQSLQSQIHQLDDSHTTPPRQHCTPPETAMFCNFNMFS